jgi:hypothetical protein
MQGPPDNRLTTEQEQELAAILFQAIASGSLALLYCRRAETGQLEPVLCVIDQNAEGFEMMPIATVVMPGSNPFEIPSEADNQEFFDVLTGKKRPDVIEVTPPSLVLPGR